MVKEGRRSQEDKEHVGNGRVWWHIKKSVSEETLQVFKQQITQLDVYSDLNLITFLVFITISFKSSGMDCE